MIHAEEFLLDADDFLHDLDAVVVLAGSGEDVALGVELYESLSGTCVHGI